MLAATYAKVGDFTQAISRGRVAIERIQLCVPVTCRAPYQALPCEEALSRWRR